MGRNSKNNETIEKKHRLSRRKFLKGAGVTTIGAAIATSGVLKGIGERAQMAEGGSVLGPGTIPLTLNINGRALTTNAEPRETLAEVLRNHFQLTGTKISCDRGACGSCTVLVDGEPVCSCHTLAIDAVDHKIQSIEGLMNGEQLHAVQQAFIDHDGMQCGFCTPGMIMSCNALLDKNPHPSLEDVKQAVSGNLCRCGTYPKVFEAVLAAAKQIRGRG